MRLAVDTLSVADASAAAHDVGQALERCGVSISRCRDGQHAWAVSGRLSLVIETFLADLLWAVRDGQAAAGGLGVLLSAASQEYERVERANAGSAGGVRRLVS